MRKIITLLVLVVSALNGSIAQTTYYVDATSGDDTHSGLSPSLAWQTIDKVNDQSYVAGDQILFKRDEIWTGEQLEVAGYSGASGQPITFGAYPGAGENPIITVITNHALTWTDQGDDIWKANTPPSYHPDRIWVDGIEILRANNISELNQAIFFWLYSAPENGDLYLKSTTNPAAKQLTYTNGRIPLYLENTNYIYFENLDLRGGWTSVYVNTNSNNLEFSGMSIGQHAGTGIDINSENASLPSNIHITGCQFDADFALDYSTAPAYAGSGDRGSSDGIFLQATDHCEIDHCFFKNWGHASVNVDGNPNGGATVKATYISVHDNYMTSPDICYGGRIGVDDAQYSEVYNNQIINTSVQTQFAGRNNHYHHNLIVGTTNPPIIPNSQEISAGISVESYSNTEVFGNIFENNIIANTEGAGFRLTNSGGFDIYDNVIRNNIIINCGNVAENGIGLNVQPNTTECEIRDNDFLNNLIFNTSATNTIDFRGTTYDMTGFQALNGTSGFEIINNIADNPLFMDDANGDYHLTANSPCINAGTTTLASEDFEGNPIPVGSAPDIGLFEYQTVLPITIVEPFAARRNGTGVKLTWATSEEVENDYYLLSKSQNLNTWSPLTTIYPNTQKIYSVIDSEPFAGISYYRLTQKDLDGQMNEIGIVSIQFKGSRTPIIFPNPAQDQLSIAFSEKSNFGELEIFVFDILGELVLAQKINNVLDISTLDAGFYTISILNERQVWYNQFVKK